jgi:DNA repair exonuclease SbcCD nuclease subunit
VILCAGDIFDTKVPKLETLKRAVDIFNKAKVPVFAIFGNHERRARDMTNPVHLLEASTNIKLLHAKSAVFEKNGEKIQIFGMGSVPEEYAEVALKKSLEEFKGEGAFKILMIHQSIKELMVYAEEEISMEYLESLPFDLIINGHIHETIVKLGGRLLIPGSTVITQLKKEEMAGKGYFLFDTETKKSEFIDIECRKFFYEKLKFDDVGGMEIHEEVARKIAEIKKDNPEAIISLKLEGNLKQGLSNSDIKLEEFPNVFIENKMNSQTLGAMLEKIRDLRQENLSVREIALKELKAKTDGKISFDSSHLFEKLLLGTEETIEYLEKEYKKDS